ncbi:unnamed protein product [Trifolium pratense]|uniref:Uncharacterized protein n=1 Tax=Trifolium pratense TaxID=57577 RepID=A0ACB0J420_TRIPR|nr:unnamed protein product [Trifolium pratense]
MVRISTTKKEERVRPTASARRRGYRRATSSEQQVVEEPYQDLKEAILKAVQDVGADDADVDCFSGGPVETPILKTYADHVACQLWDEVDQGEDITAINKQLSILTITSPPPTLSSNESLQVLPLPTLPLDLISEIFCRLPVKLLLQLRCVCKSWNSLISDPNFAKKHLHMSTTRCLHFVSYSNFAKKYIFSSYPLRSVFSTLSTNVIQFEYHPINHTPNNSYYIVGSCNGILCLANYYDECFVLLWNPSIRKFKELPPFQKPDLISHCRMSSGFGYDPISDKYKVVVVLVFCVPDSSGNLVDKTEVKVHTLGTNFWTSIHEFPFGGIPVELSGKFVSGTINWLASKVWPRKNPCFIVSLDLRNESYQEILQPDYGEVNVNKLSLGVLKDCLCMISGHDVWLMKEYGNKVSWIKLFTVSRMSNALTKAIYIFKNDQVLLESIGAWYKKLIVYDPRSDTFKFKKRSAYNPSDIPPEVCVESLLSPWS